MESWLDRFWAKVEVRGEYDCWDWVAGKFSQGYGQFRLNGKTLHAHRLSWEIANGSIPKGDNTYHGNCILHSCHNRACVNPKHLRVGTQYDNIQDRNKAGRTASGVKSGKFGKGYLVSGSKNPMFGRSGVLSPAYGRNGELSATAKLKNSDVLAIRESHSLGLTRSELAKQYNVAYMTISFIVRRITWTHI